MRRFVLGCGLMLSLSGSASAQFMGQPYGGGYGGGYGGYGGGFGGGYGGYGGGMYGPYQQPGYGFGYGGSLGQMYGSNGYPTVMPNIYNPANQPLSPYLNLLRGGNAGVNYYYGVRPGTVGGASRFGGAPFFSMGGYRPLFFPQLAVAPDPLEAAATGPGNVLPPAGHPVVFSNTMGYFPMGGVQAGGNRGGLSGLGAARPPARR